MLRIFLARHGETEWNKQRKLQGEFDIPLNETGRAQAARLADLFVDVTLNRIFCSARTRARQTAAALDGRAPLTVLPGLNERSLGCFQGKVLDGTDPCVIEEYERRTREPNDTLDGGESLEQHLARVTISVTEILTAVPAGTVLLVGHGGTNSQVLRALLGLTAERALQIRQANDEIYRVDIEDGAPVAVAISQVDGPWADAGLL